MQASYWGELALQLCDRHKLDGGGGGRGKDHMIIAPLLFSKSSIFILFSVHTKTQSQLFQISSGLISVLKKLRFRDGLVYTVGLTVAEATF